MIFNGSEPSRIDRNWKIIFTDMRDNIPDIARLHAEQEIYDIHYCVASLLTIVCGEHIRPVPYKITVRGH